MEFIWSVIIGALAGFIASKIIKGKGMGIILNLIVGVIGGLLGGWIFSLLGLSWSGIIGSLVMSTVGAITLLWGLSVFKRNK